MTQSSDLYAVVTGAGGGLGKAFAIQLAHRGYNLILVCLPNEGLDELASELSSTYGIDVLFREIDLALSENVISLAQWINDSYKVALLVNNAGIGGSQSFVEASYRYISRIIQLNVTATTLLSRELLPNLLRQNSSYILNVSSIAAFIPTGYKTVYPATKSFIYSFSRGLNAELSGKGVSVCVVHPGPMRTNLEISARIDRQGWFAKILLNEPEEVAKLSLEGLFKCKSVIIPNRWASFLLNLIPKDISIPLLTKSIKKELAQ